VPCHSNTVPLVRTSHVVTLRRVTSTPPQVWHYRDTDPDFGQWQAKELLDHMEGVLTNEPVEVVSGNTIVEVKPQARRRFASLKCS